MENDFTTRTKDMSVAQERFEAVVKRDITLPQVIDVYKDWAENYDKV